MKILFAAAVFVATGFFPTSGGTTQERTVAAHAVTSRRDPEVKINLPNPAQYVGRQTFLLSQPQLGHTERCELFAFVEPDKNRQIIRYWWIQFEAYLPGHPQLHMTYDSPQHAQMGGLDFYVDAGVASPSKPPMPGSDGAHFTSVLASHGYGRGDTMWVRFVHLVDAAKRKELMIIYAESLRPTGYSAAQLSDGGADRAKWAVLKDRLIRRAQQSLDLSRNPTARPPTS